MSARSFANASLAWLDGQTLRASEWIVERGARALAFFRRRVPETVIVLIALVTRFSMLATYHPNNGYDAYDHLVYIQWFAHHLSFPPLMLCRETYHPPLYYILEGLFSRLLQGRTAMMAMTSMVFSSGTVLLIWFGLERFLPRRRLARIAALALAAILPAAVQPAGMVSAEGLNGFLATSALLLAADALARQQRGQAIIWRAVLVGVIVGLQMLAKISALVTLAAIGAGAAFAVAFGGGDLAARARRTVPWLVLVASFGATCGWYYVRNQKLHHKAVLSGYDGLDSVGTQKLQTPYLKRRPPDFFYGWSSDILANPYAPTGASPRSYFWPVVVASTFVDYYNYSYVRGPDRPTPLSGNYKPLREAAVPFSVASVAGGVVIAASTVVAWFWVMIGCVRRRQPGIFALLLAPALAIVGQLHFVVQYPFDYQGPIKGVYLQFGTASLFALFGLAVYKMMQRRLTLPIGILQCAAIVAVASYTVYARAFAL